MTKKKKTRAEKQAEAMMKRDPQAEGTHVSFGFFPAGEDPTDALVEMLRRQGKGVIIEDLTPAPRKEEDGK
jgi:hypothetical protein